MYLEIEISLESWRKWFSTQTVQAQTWEGTHFSLHWLQKTHRYHVTQFTRCKTSFLPKH